MLGKTTRGGMKGVAKPGRGVKGVAQPAKGGLMKKKPGMPKTNLPKRPPLRPGGPWKPAVQPRPGTQTKRRPM